MRKKLTPKLIDSLPLPIGKRYEVRDELLTGLVVRVSATGGKVWYTCCRIEGKIRRIKIGTYPILSLADAREKARPGTMTRRRKAPEPVLEATFPMQDPVPAPETAQVIGYGSTEAMEGTCDAHVIWSRATPPMRSVIGGLMDGKSQIEIASKMKLDRFKVARLVTTLQGQFAKAA